jgi:hypothetical protein
MNWGDRLRRVNLAVDKAESVLARHAINVEMAAQKVALAEATLAAARARANLAVAARDAAIAEAKSVREVAKAQGF